MTLGIVEIDLRVGLAQPRALFPDGAICRGLGGRAGQALKNAGLHEAYHRQLRPTSKLRP